jgi:hypothetical protein
VPPFLRGGEKAIVPPHAPFVALHVTVPGKIGLAPATPGATVTRRSDGKVIAARKRTILRTIASPGFAAAGSSPPCWQG